MSRAAALLWICALLAPAAGHAYSLQTAVSDSCHERITVASLDLLRDLVRHEAQIEVPDDPLLRELLGTLQFPDTADDDEQTRYVMLSIIVGVRSPDTDGHSTLNLGALRRLHADPDARGQYAHALRGPDDDGIAGDIAAVDGTIAAIVDEVRTGARLAVEGGALSQGGLIAYKPAYLDHYGLVELPVGLFAWHVGRALHALQDAHAHMVWNADVSHVVGVLNYIDAVEGRLQAHDGLAHSDALDDCLRADVAPLVDAATRRTAALVRAIVTAIRERDDTPLRAGLTPCADDATDRDACGWLVYNPACRAAVAGGDEAAIAAVCCDASDDFCQSPFAPIARQDPAHPYLGCAVSPGGQPRSGWPWLALLLALGGRRGLLGLVALAALMPTPAGAEPPRLSVAIEGHVAGLDDRVGAALLAPDMGYGLRVGWRVDRWRVGLHVERDHWISVEYGVQADPGVLDVAAFGEALFFDDAVRVGLSIGTSTLLFDTVLHEAGNTGLFVEARPVGLRFPVSDALWIVLDPFTTAVVMPAVELDERLPSLRKVQRRTALGIEGCFL